MFMSFQFIFLSKDLGFFIHTGIFLEAKWGRLHFWTIFVVSGIGAQVSTAIARTQTINAGPACGLVAIASASCFEVLLVCCSFLIVFVTQQTSRSHKKRQRFQLMKHLFGLQLTSQFPS
jgi:membrane associated rhomboid family serine protease